MVPIVFHQFESSHEPRRIEEPHPEPLLAHEITKAARALAVRREHVKDLGQHRYRRQQGFAEGAERLAASRVLGITAVEQRDQRSRVDQDHRRRPSLRLITFRTPRRVLVEGAMAYPPGPTSSCA